MVGSIVVHPESSDEDVEHRNGEDQDHGNIVDHLSAQLVFFTTIVVATDENEENSNDNLVQMRRIECWNLV